MDDLDVALILYLEDEQSSSEESRSEESELFKNMSSEGAFQILYRVSHSWISVILREVVEAIIKRMFHVVLPTPTMGQFQKIGQKYSTKWNFPNCIGAIDGKHVRIKPPKNSGSLFYNYKDYHSVVMLAVVDADCKFTAVDVG
ncbi:uncharacterized protein TNCV_566171 [Trichonephila clavipes]|nr:uncharacterized protein TNCV_566171 [Trichonephila clavipes]